MADVKHTDEDWQRVGTEITARIAELKLTPAEIYANHGISWKTLTGYMNGEPIVRQDKARALCAALGWTTRSIELVLAGGPPELLEPTAPTDGVSNADLAELMRERFDELATIGRELVDLLRLDVQQRPAPRSRPAGRQEQA